MDCPAEKLRDFDGKKVIFMKKVLIVSVGGSYVPVVTAITEIKPDRVVFLCSGGTSQNSSINQVMGEGTPCELRKGADVIKKEPNILVQTGYDSRFDKDSDLIIVDDPDDIIDCYKKIEEKISLIKTEDPECSIFADYTGGTKTMSAALAMVSMDYNISSLFVTTTQRRNLIKVEGGQFPKRIGTSVIHHKRRLKQILPAMIKQFNYPAVIEELKAVLMECELPNEEQKILRENLRLFEGLDTWDRFEHLTALELLEPLMGKDKGTGTQVMFLKRVIAGRSKIDNNFNTEGYKVIIGHGYEVVEDLLLNAQRRAHQRRYDDAVGRIYRALELTAQLRLKMKYDLLTGDIEINNKSIQNLPEERLLYLEKKRNDRGIIQIALKDSLDLLNNLGDKTGIRFKENESRILDVLIIRNNSLFAHGFNPVGEADYRRIDETIGGFIREGIEEVRGKRHEKPSQFPQDFNFEW